MVNLLKIVWVSCFEHKSGIRQNLLVGICISVMETVFYGLALLETAFIYIRVFMIELTWNWLGDSLGNGNILMILQI